MKIVHILNKKPSPCVLDLIEEHRKLHEVEIINLEEQLDYDAVIDKVINCDRVISWGNVHEGHLKHAV